MIKKYIIKKLTEWLELENIKNDINENYIEYKAFKRMTSADMELHESQIHNINQLYSVGVDFDPRDHRSWAVICIEGKPNYVKFVDLNRSDVREVQRFLRQFEGSTRRVVDTPLNMDFLFLDDKLWGRK